MSPLRAEPSESKRLPALRGGSPCRWRRGKPLRASPARLWTQFREQMGLGSRTLGVGSRVLGVGSRVLGVGLIGPRGWAPTGVKLH